ncbi:putative oxalocrotonate tautomerase [Triangularia verruculosa]|uniref:Oxalocrotonate tautomerase n=1 Tax=Triangularia verruculosa TaxID=2587418 RepID=A0AAN6XQC8_9PEZI|nr:putative oxalocrotonate tautomerase [Triangularia verruculosa]
MPLWLVYHPEGTFSTPEEKKALTTDIIKIYTMAGLPAFYVIVNFIKLTDDNIFIGGENPSQRDKPFIRLVAEHIAVHVTNDSGREERTIKRIDEALKPHIADKGYDWEWHVDETPRALWKINGLVPPPFGSKAEKEWFDLNKPVSWEEEK